MPGIRQKRQWMIVLLLMVGITVALLYVARFTPQYGLLCERLGGKWAARTGQCISRDCYKDHSCGVWVNPGVRCSLLKVGDPASEAYFQLGEPERSAGEFRYWTSFKAEDRKIVVRLRNESIIGVQCNIPESVVD